MHRGVVVPQGDHARFPAQAAGEGGLRAMRHQEIDDRLGLEAGHALDTAGVRVADIERFLTRLGMSADQWVTRATLALLELLLVGERDRPPEQLFLRAVI